MKKVDYIIVGQGLAGTLLAHFLLQENKKLLIIDPGLEGSASKVAAGIINPVTGRRYVKSWRIDELIPFAKQTYRSIEEMLTVSIYHPRNIIRTLFNAREENDWIIRTGDPVYASYMSQEVNLGSYHDHTIQAFSYGEVQQAAQVDIGQLIRAYRIFFQQKDCLLEESMDYQSLSFKEGQLRYGDIIAEKVIFCEGAGAVNNPFFNYLPFSGAKGEVLTVKLKNVAFEKILKHRIFIVPLKEETYWIGSTYNWKFEGARPTEEGYKYLTGRLKEVLNIPFEVISHEAAIRPTVKDRRPFLGLHPNYPQLAIFNGLGTKGASLGPFWAKYMTDSLLSDGKITKEVNIARFEGAPS